MPASRRKLLTRSEVQRLLGRKRVHPPMMPKRLDHDGNTGRTPPGEMFLCKRLHDYRLS